MGVQHGGAPSQGAGDVIGCMNGWNRRLGKHDSTCDTHGQDSIAVGEASVEMGL